MNNEGQEAPDVQTKASHEYGTQRENDNQSRAPSDL